MAVCELNKYYMVTNYTRNQKGYLNAAEVNGDLLADYKLGDLVAATVIERQGMRIKRENETVDISRKLQLTMNPSTLNFGLSAANIVPGLVLSGIVASIQETGVIIELGLPDGTKALVKQAGSGQFKEGSGVQIVAVKVKLRAKIVVAVDLSSTKGKEMCLTAETQSLTFETLKPGCLVKCGMKQKYQNGIEVSFLGHFSGFIFLDHLRKSPEDYKKKEHFQARIIAIKQSSKLVALSQLPHIVDLTKLPKYPVTPGDCFKSVAVTKLIYGSYEVKLEKDNKQCTALLHKSHVSDELQKNITEGYFLPEVEVQEINYFDNKPIIRLKTESSTPGQAVMNYESLKCGEVLSVQITDVKSTGIGVRVNSHIRGFIPLHQIANIPLHQVPSKFVKNKAIKAAVYVVSSADKYVELTLKPKLLKEAKEGSIKLKKEEYEVNEQITGMVVNSRVNVGIFLQFWGDVFGILYDEELVAHGRDQSSFKKGELLSVYVKRNESTKRMLTLSFEPNKLVKAQKTNPSNLLNSAILQEIQSLNSKSKKKVPASLSIGQFISCSIILPQNEILASCPQLLKQYQDARNELKNSSLFLVQFDKSQYGVLPASLLSPFFPLFLSQKLLSSQMSKTEPLLLVVTKLVDHIPIMGSGALLKQLGKREVVKGTEVYGLVERFNHDYGVTFNLLEGGVGLAKKENLAYFSQNIYEHGRYFRLKVTGIPEDKKAYLKNDYTSSLDESEKEVIAACFKRDLNFLHSLVPHSIELGGLEKVKKLKQSGARMEVKTKSEQLLTIEVSNFAEYDGSSRFWMRVLDWTQDVLIAEFVSSQRYKALASSDSTMQEARVLVDNAQFSMIEQKQSTAPAYVLKKQPLVATELPQLTSIYTVDLLYLSPSLALPKQYTRMRGASEQFAASSTEIQFTVTSAKPTSLQGKATQGKNEVSVRLSKAQSSESIQAKWEQIQNGTKLKARVLGQNRANPKYQYLELTMLPSSHPNTKPLDLLTEEESAHLTAVVQQVKQANSAPLVVHTSLSSRGRVAFQHIPLSLLPKGSRSQIDLKSLFPVGRVIQVKKLEAAKSDQKSWHHYFTLQGKQSKLCPGAKRIIRCIKSISGKGVIAQLDQENYGFIDITEIADQFIADPIALLMDSRSSGGYWVARILGQDSSHHQKWKLSTRSSLHSDKLYKLMQPDSSSQLFIKTFSRAQGDLRNYLLKYADTEMQLIERGTLLVGYVSNCNQSGCFIRISTSLTVRAASHELQHSPAFYLPGRCVICRVLSVTKDKRVHVSLKQHFVKTGVNLSQNDLKKGKLVECSVLAAAHRKLFVQINGSSFKGKIKLKSENIYEANSSLVCRIVKCDKSQHPPKFKLDVVQRSTIQEKDVINKAQAQSAAEQEIYEVVSKMYEAEEVKERMEIAAEDLGEEEEDEEDNMIQQLQELNELEESEQEEQEEEGESEEDVKLIAEEEQEEEDEEKEGDQEQEGDSMSSASEELDESSEEEEEQKRESKSLNQRLKEEKKVRAAQKEIMETDLTKPTTVAGFEKALLRDSQRAVMWIQYAAFVLEHQDGLELARKVFERGVRKIDPVHQTQKLNLYLAYLNLEYSYGKDRDQFNSILRKALQVNDKLKVYGQLIKMYRLSKDHRQLLLLFPQLVKKYKSHYNFWEQYLQWAYDIKHTQHIARQDLEGEEDLEELDGHAFPEVDEDAKLKAIQEAEEIKKLERVPKTEEVLSRGLQSLAKADHIKFITKSARLEYHCGSPEQGRTLFEGIVTNYPKRSDVWSVYFDCEIKYSLPKAVRVLFERCIAMEDLPLNKIKFFYKRYMDYESKYGTAKRVEQIKQKAVNFVNRLPGQEEEENQEQNQEEGEESEEELDSEED